MVQPIEQLAQRLRRMLARVGIEEQRVEFVFIEDALGTVGIDPQIEGQIHLRDMVRAKDGGLYDVAVPALEMIVLNRVDLKDVVPTIGVEMFDKAIVVLEDRVTVIGGGAIEAGFESNVSGRALQDFAAVRPHEFVLEVEFLDGDGRHDE